MKIDTGVLLPVIAVVASVLLVLAGKARVFELIALGTAGVWLALQLRLFTWPLEDVSPGFVIGGALIVAGAAVYLNTGNKREVTASTVIAILGGVLVVDALGTLG